MFSIFGPSQLSLLTTSLQEQILFKENIMPQHNKETSKEHMNIESSVCFPYNIHQWQLKDDKRYVLHLVEVTERDLLVWLNIEKGHSDTTFKIFDHNHNLSMTLTKVSDDMWDVGWAPM